MSKAKPIPFHTYLDDLMTASGVKNVEVAEALNYPRPNVIAMFRSGSMKVPANKLKDLAAVLQVEPLPFIRRAMAYYDPELWATFENLLGDRLVSANELALLTLIRQQLHGVDIDLVADDEFVARLNTMIGMAFDRVVRSEAAQSRASTGRRDSAITRANDEMNQLLERQAAEREELRKRQKVEQTLAKAA